LVLFTFFIPFVSFSFGQNGLDVFFKQSDTLNTSRKNTVLAVEALVATEHGRFKPTLVR
jgi:hypothetical protein